MILWQIGPLLPGTGSLSAMTEKHLNKSGLSARFAVDEDNSVGTDVFTSKGNEIWDGVTARRFTRHGSNAYLHYKAAIN